MKTLIGRLIYWLGFPVIWLIIRRTRRAKVMMVAGKEILLVKNAISSDGHWTLPGGGCKGKETAKVCASREVREEVGYVFDPKNLRYLGEIGKAGRYIKYKASIFAVSCEKKKDIKSSLEIAEAKWFKLNDLPAKRKQLVDQAISLAKQG